MSSPPLTTLPNPIRPAFEQGTTEGSVIVNIGPSHPATHGTIQIVAELSGERVIRTDVHCGYLHRGFEKECEAHTWHNLIPYVDRLNYCSALINDFAYCGAVETMMGIELTPRARMLRTLLSEYSRIADHVTCIAAGLMELGAMTAFLYLVTIRDYIYEHLADLTGARVTYSYGRIGGLARDLPEGWLKRLGEILDEMDTFTGRVHGLVDRNRIFIAEHEKMNLIDKDRFEFVWVVDFPMFEIEEGRVKALHHPFTMPRDLNHEHLEDIESIAYDIVLNGTELGGGSIRIHKQALQEQIFTLLGIGEEEAQEKFGFLLDALKFGAPPHGGFAGSCHVGGGSSEFGACAQPPFRPSRRRRHRRAGGAEAIDILAPRLVRQPDPLAV